MPGLTITASGGHEDFGKIVSGLASGQSPDLLDLGTLDAYAARGMLKKLSPYSDQTPTLQRNYLQPVWSNGTWNGDLYGIPALDHGPEVGLVWNESLAGDHLSASTPPASWDDLLTVGASLTTRDDSGGLKVLGFDPLDGVGGLLDTARDVTGLDWFDPSARKINLANGTYAAFLQSIATLYTTVGISQLAQFRQDVPPLTGDAGSGMCSGRQVAILTGYWSAAELKRLRRDSSWTFGATWLPPRPAGAKVQRIAGRTITIPTAAPHPNDAWAAIQVLVGDDTNADFLARTGRFAATKSFVGSAAVRQYPELRFFIESIDQATMLSARENNPVAGFAQSKWEQAIQAVLGGGTTAPDALAAAQKSTEIELARLAK
jgi:ABC-type glycerol-3-phosphate transport system substrate-binding protein